MLQNTELIFDVHTHTRTPSRCFFVCRVLTINFVALFLVQVFKACKMLLHCKWKLNSERVSINMCCICACMQQSMCNILHGKAACLTTLALSPVVS